MNAPILPPSLVVRNDGTVLQIATGFAFPFTIGGLPRIDVRMYDAHGFNVGVTYRGSERSAPWVTLYSLPGRPTDGLMDTFVDSEEELARTHDDLVVVSRRRFAVAFEGGRRALGMQAAVRGRRALDLPDTVSVRAWLVLLQSDSEGSIVSEHPIGDYSVFGLGEHPALYVPIFAVKCKDSGTPTLSYRAKELFVTEWLDDAPAAKRIAFHSGPNGTLDVVFFEDSAQVSVRRYALLEIGFSELAVAVLSSGRGRLLSVRIDARSPTLECAEATLLDDLGGLAPQS